jgi:hypothetical protein
MADLQDASAQLKAGIAQVDALWDEVPKLNKMLADAGVPYFNVNLNPARPTGGRGRGN